MKLKTYRAATMPLALAQVKRDLGADAVIVHTRTLKRGGLLGLGARLIVEITARRNEGKAAAAARNANAERLRQRYAGGAAPDRFEPVSHPAPAAPPAAPPARTASPPPVSVVKTPAATTPAARRAAVAPTPAIPLDNGGLSDELKQEIGKIRTLVENLVREHRQMHAPQMPEQLFDVYLDLVQREVAEEMAREMIAQVQQDLTGNQLLSAHVVRQRLVETMQKMINVGGPISRNLDGAARVVALIGPTGVGKTTTIAKLAANFKLRQNKKVGLITIDTYRIGAVDQLRMYAQIIDVPLRVVLTPGELREAVAAMKDLDVVLIDTAGRSQNDKLKIKELKTFLEAAGPHEVHLVLSSTAHHTHILSAAEEFKKLGVDRLIFTKLDEAISFGVVLSVMQKVDASISYITTGQDVPDDIEIGNGRRLAQLLLGMEELGATPIHRQQGVVA
jgi:flagellar biosynthesis protein FlhF